MSGQGDHHPDLQFSPGAALQQQLANRHQLQHLLAPPPPPQQLQQQLQQILQYSQQQPQQQQPSHQLLQQLLHQAESQSSQTGQPLSQDTQMDLPSVFNTLVNVAAPAATHFNGSFGLNKRQRLDVNGDVAVRHPGQWDLPGIRPAQRTQITVLLDNGEFADVSEVLAQLGYEVTEAKAKVAEVSELKIKMAELTATLATMQLDNNSRSQSTSPNGSPQGKKKKKKDDMTAEEQETALTVQRALRVSLPFRLTRILILTLTST